MGPRREGQLQTDQDLEFGFDRMVIWGGKGHEPITLHTFLHSFFSFQNVTPAEKLSRDDPGARFGTFDFSYRLPFLSRWITLYTDSLVHDDVSPISAPRVPAFIRESIWRAFRVRASRSATGGRQHRPVSTTPDGTPFNRASFFTTRVFSGRAPPTKASWWATGLDARERAVRPG